MSSGISPHCRSSSESTRDCLLKNVFLRNVERKVDCGMDRVCETITGITANGEKEMTDERQVLFMLDSSVHSYSPYECTFCYELRSISDSECYETAKMHSTWETFTMVTLKLRQKDREMLAFDSNGW